MEQKMPVDAQQELAVIIAEWRESLKLLVAASPTFLNYPDRFSTILTAEEMDERDLNDDLKPLKQIISSLPYSQKGLRQRLEKIIRTVPQVKAICVSPWELARSLDLLLFNVNEASALGQSLDHVEYAVSYLATKFFEEPFTRMALVHLYNLKTQQSEIRLPKIEARILTLTEEDLPLVTGERTLTSWLHYEHSGNCFLVFENSDIQEPENWLGTAWDKAWGFISLLKYLKNEVVDIDYVGKFYSPRWANAVKRYGVDIMGRQRWDEQLAPYLLCDDMLPTLHQYTEAATALAPVLSDFSSDLRRIIQLAGQRYEIHHKRTSLVEQLLELTIALEALFSPSTQTELRFRISQSVALLVGSDIKQRKEIFDFVKRMYDERSGFVHGGRDPADTGKVTPADIRRLGDLVRQAILRFAVLFVRGDRLRKNIHDEIALAAFDSGKADELRTRSDFESYLRENFPQQNVA